MSRQTGCRVLSTFAFHGVSMWYGWSPNMSPKWPWLLGTVLVATSCVSDLNRTDQRAQVSQQERTLVAIVGDDLARSKECNDGTGSMGVAVNEYAATASGMVSDEWIEAYARPESWVQMKSLTQSLRSGNTRERLIDWRLAESKMLTNRDLSALTSRDLDKLAAAVRCFATFMVPVVSTDGTTALVAFHVGPSPHGSIAFYVLRQGASGWSVSAREFFAFM